jgi:hypothetical protein
VACFGTALAALRDGIGLSPDGWVYWEGSVSLLHGLGYRLFLGSARITSWPPLFAMYLACFQAVLGVSGRSLAVATAAAAGLAGFLWTRLFVGIIADADPERPPSPARLLLLPIFLIAFVGALFRLLLADTLALALLPAALSSAIRLGTERSLRRRNLAVRLAAVSGWLFLCLECKNSALAWAMGAAVLVARLRWNKSSPRRALVLGSLVFIVPFTGWLAVQAALGPDRSHAVAFGSSQYSAFEYAGQALENAAGMIGPTRFLRGGELLTLLLLVGTAATIRAWRGTFPETARLLASILLFAAVSLAATAALLALTGLPDELGGRFVWFVPIILVSCSITVWSKTLYAGLSDRAFGLLIFVVVGISGFYAIRSLRPARTAAEPPPGAGRFVHNDESIEPGFLERPPERRGPIVLISPPVLDWERTANNR